MEEFATFAARHWPLFAALVMILVLLAGSFLMGSISGIKGVSPAEAVQLINHENAVVLDVRDDKEHAESHIVGAVHVPRAVLPERIKELEKYRSKPVIVMCRSGNRSSSAAQVLRKNGFENVSNLKGGILAWQNASLPTMKG